MTETKFTPRFVQAERNAAGRLVATGTLKHGIVIGSTVHREFVLQEANAGDLLDAEQSADTSKSLGYSVALLARQLQKVGTFDGPFTLAMLRALKQHDLVMLREAQAELDIVGELS